MVAISRGPTLVAEGVFLRRQRMREQADVQLGGDEVRTRCANATSVLMSRNSTAWQGRNRVWGDGDPHHERVNRRVGYGGNPYMGKKA